MSKITIIILAAGNGSRMSSDRPKVLHEIGGKPLLRHVVDAVEPLKSQSGEKCELYIVYQHQALRQQCSDIDCQWVHQEEPKGTGDAVLKALPYLKEGNDMTLIVYGDVPLLQTDTLQNLLDKAADNPDKIALLLARTDNPDGYGRIIRNNNNEITAIVEHRDADESQRNIKEINTGIMALSVDILKRHLASLKNNNGQREYYLTDIVDKAKRNHLTIESAYTSHSWEFEGINSPEQLNQVEAIYNKYLSIKTNRSEKNDNNYQEHLPKKSDQVPPTPNTLTSASKRVKTAS